MSVPRRQPGPIRRTIVTPTAPSAAPATNLLLRTPTPVAPSMPVRRSRALPMTGAQRDATGARSDWNKPCHLRPFTTAMTHAWSYTATDMPRGGVQPSSATSRNVPTPPR